MDPFVAMHAVPAEPRCWFLGSGPSTFTSRWRERLIHRLGGLLPVWRGGLGIEGHVRSARASSQAGACSSRCPRGRSTGRRALGPFRPGAALIALRTGATIVPLAMAGTEELYIGRRMASQVLPPTTVRELLADAWDGVLPEPDSRAELDLAAQPARRSRLASARSSRRSIRGPSIRPSPRRLRRRLTWLFLGPGPLEH